MQEVTVYLLKKDKTINFNALLQEFPPQIQNHITRYKYEEAREDSICAYHLLDSLLAGSRELSLENISFSGSKPALPGINFSISHSNGMVACCITDFPVGVDIEQYKKLPKNVQKSFIDSQSYEELFQDEESAEKEIIRWWTVRESIGKYLGTGITREVLSLPLIRDNDTFTGDKTCTVSRLLADHALSATQGHPFSLSVEEVSEEILQ